MDMKKTYLVALAALVIATNVRAETTLFYHEPSQYTVLIPETIVADGTQYTFEAPVMDLCDGESVTVTVDNVELTGAVRLYTSTNKEMIAELYGENGKLTPGQVVAQFGNGIHQAGLVYALPFSTEGAGDYYGTVQFFINLVKN